MIDSNYVAELGTYDAHNMTYYLMSYFDNDIDIVVDPIYKYAKGFTKAYDSSTEFEVSKINLDFEEKIATFFNDFGNPTMQAQKIIEKILD